MISADPIDTLVELFPRLFRGQRPGSFSLLPEGYLFFGPVAFKYQPEAACATGRHSEQVFYSCLFRL